MMRYRVISIGALSALLLIILVVASSPAAQAQTPVLPGQINGVVFLDVNGNGEQDEGEPGIADVIVELISVQGTVSLPVTDTTTDEQGQYLFAEQPGARDYRVRITVPDGYTNTTPVSVDFSLAEDGEAIVNFGLRLADSMLYLSHLAKD